MRLVPLSEMPFPPAIQDADLANPIEIYKVCKEMEVLCSKSNGIGLSAVQVGIPLKLFIVDFRQNNYGYFLNCEYVPVDGTAVTESIEGCLSLPDRFFVVNRHAAVRVKGWHLTPDAKIEAFEKDFKGLYGVVMQHEIDHHNGIMIDSIGKEYLLRN